MIDDFRRKRTALHARRYLTTHGTWELEASEITAKKVASQLEEDAEKKRAALIIFGLLAGIPILLILFSVLMAGLLIVAKTLLRFI